MAYCIPLTWLCLSTFHMPALMPITHGPVHAHFTSICLSPLQMYCVYFTWLGLRGYMTFASVQWIQLCLYPFHLGLQTVCLWTLYMAAPLSVSHGFGYVHFTWLCLYQFHFTVPESISLGFVCVHFILLCLHPFCCTFQLNLSNNLSFLLCKYELFTSTTAYHSTFTVQHRIFYWGQLSPAMLTIISIRYYPAKGKTRPALQICHISPFNQHCCAHHFMVYQVNLIFYLVLASIFLLA